MVSFGKTDIGMKRSINQDSLFFSDESIGNLPNLYIVADGMGGHKAGDFASSYAVERFVELVKQSEHSNPITIIKYAINSINKELLELAAKEDKYQGMGTTFVVTVVLDKKLYVANIGDSRLYVIGEDIKQITLDHSLVEELIRTGQLERRKGRYHPEKNIITRALGASDEAIPDFFEVELRPNDRILMCSDGLSNMVEDDEIKEIVMDKNTPQQAVEQLIDRANYYGGKDNIGVVLVQQ